MPLTRPSATLSPHAGRGVILAEIMRGLRDERQAAKAWSRLEVFDVMTLGGQEVALKAAANYRPLRSEGVTVRGTVDLIITTWCIVHDVPLIHTDRDFQGMTRLGLKTWP